MSYLALAIVGLQATTDFELRAAYIDMNRIGWLVIVPISIASVLTGVIQSGMTAWGYFRHYWIVLKLFLSAACLMGLIVHMLPTRAVALRALHGTLTSLDALPIRRQLIFDASLALVVLLVLIALSMLKPQGRLAARDRSNPRRE
ncbi:MAG: hypothetical protein ACJ8MR_13815 [Povalibacter sp.]